MKGKARRILSILMVMVIIISSMGVPVGMADTVGLANYVIISQIYGAGGNSGALYTHDFIELYNPTDQPVNLSGWSIQYATAANTAKAFSGKMVLNGTINAKGYYLIQLAGGTNGVALPVAADESSTQVNMGGTAGQVALVSNSETITGVLSANVVDFVGFGTTAAEFEGSKAPAPSTTESIIRVTEGVDTNNNGLDFKKTTPNPRNSAYTGMPVVESKCAPVTSNILGGVVPVGTQITLSTATSGATIEYNLVSAESTEWTTGSVVTISESATVYARATKEGLENSDVATFAYTVDVSAPLTVKEAKETALATTGVKVQGVVSYISGRNVYIQDATGAICLYLSANASRVKVGDLVIATGTRANFNDLVQLSAVNEALIQIVSSGNVIPDRGTATIAELIFKPEDRTTGFDHMCEILKIEGATLSELSKLSQAGSDIAIFPAINLSNYPGIALGDEVNLTVRVNTHNSNMQVAIIEMVKAGTENNIYLTVTPGSTDVTSGASIAITSNVETASIYYTLDGSTPTAESLPYNGGIKITGEIGESVVLKAFAKADGKNDSDVYVNTYKIKDPNAALTIKEVLAYGNQEKADVTVKGTLVYFATTFGNPVIQSEIGGEMYSLYIFGAAPAGAKIGDEVQFTGKYLHYSGLPEMTSITASSIVSSGTPIAAQEVTVADLKANGTKMIGRFVKVKNATLGAFNANGNTPITDATGSINLYKPAPYPIQVVQGDVVDVYAMVAVFNTTVQLYTGTVAHNGFNIYDVANDTKPPVVTLKEGYLDAKPMQDYLIGATVADNKGVASVKITYSVGANTVSDVAMAYNAENNEYQFTIPSAEILTTENQLKFRITATDVTGLTTTSPEKTINIDNKPQIVSVSPARNGSTGEVKNPLITATLQNAGVNPEVKVTLSKDGVKLVDNATMPETASDGTFGYQTATLVNGTYAVTVSVKRADGQTATTTWNFVVGTPTFRPYFGQLHAHTAEYSDGSGTLMDGLNYVKSIAANDRVDFIALTDHSNYFDTTAAANVADALNDKALMTAPSLEKWNAYVSTMATYNAQNAGAKVALPGFEMTWSGGPGHINTFGSVGLVSRNNSSLNSKSADAGLKLYYETLIKNTDPLANLSQFNHPGSTFGTFSEFAYWSAAYDNKMVAVEVGNGEGAIGSGGYFPSFTEYTKALDKGWHVAPTNNQDNHKGRWGNANTARTVIITDDLSETGLLKGLKNMSVYATEDKNLNIDFTVNDLMMGSIISEVPTEALKFVVNVDDPDHDDIIAKIDIVTNSGRIAATKTFDTNAVQWSFELPAVQGYYYVRVTQADKNIAVTAPIWVGQAPLVGISSFESMTKLPVTGEAVSLSTKLFNNEASPVTIKSITYIAGSEVLKSVTAETTVGTAGTHADTLVYTPSKAGVMNVVVEAVIVVNGQEKVFEKTLALNVRDSEKLVYVGIDASHFNEYVNGNYKDSMGNFANLAVESDVRVVELKTSEELIAATQNPKFKMLILTPPTRRNGNNFLIGYKSYSETELAAIKLFAEAGNTIVVTGWGDYYESYTKFSDGTAHVLPADQHMAFQQNLVLSAIGSTLRISDDEVKDDVTNGGQSMRLYLKNYNMANPFLQFVKPEEQVYSNYGGATIYAIGGDQKPTSTLPTTVSPMVYAFVTSYSADDDKDGTTGPHGVVVPKYDNKYMVAASEMVTFENGKTATIIAAGAVFMSNFEIQVTMDSYATPAYSNYTILENLIRYINPAVITDIAAVQAAEEGVSFTVRGIATSNASGFDKDTAFFDTIYVQDSTAGINVFPVSGDVRAGQTVEITGKTSSYNGERQISVEKLTVVDAAIKALPAPKTVTTAQAKAAMYLGSLVKLTGTITKLEYANNVIESIYVRDGSGVEARVFIDGYITKDKTIANLAVGANVTAIGLSSIDTEGSRIRVRDRSDVVCTPASSGTGSDSGTGTGSGTGSGTTPANPDPKPVEVVENNIGSKTATSTVTLTPVKSESGRTTASVSTQTIQAMVEKIVASGVNGGKATIEIKVGSESTDTNIKVVIDRAAFNTVATQSDANVKVTTASGSIQFDKKAVDMINSADESADISVTIVKVEAEALPAAVKEVVGERPVYDFTVMAGDQKVSSFGSGKANVSVPYTLQQGENPKAIVIYYVDDSGKLQLVRGKYNPVTKTVDFQTKHFSKYFVGYNAVAFNDVNKNDWYHDAVSFVSARSIANGTGEGTFDPNRSITRAQFLVMMMNALDVKVDQNATANFIDAGNTYYTNYLATAKQLGITNGVGGGKFAPNAVITRQDMITMLYKMLEVIDEVPEVDGTSVHNVTDFTDFGKVASYAQTPMKALLASGHISGSANQLNPAGLATRAQVAAILMSLLGE